MIVEFLLFSIFVFLMFYSTIEVNLFKKIIFLNLSLTFLIMLFVFHTFLFNGIKEMLPPFVSSELVKSDIKIVDPLPQALMLTAIVVGLATTSIFLAVIMKIKKYFGTINQDEINEILSLSNFKL